MPTSSRSPHHPIPSPSLPQYAQYNQRQRILSHPYGPITKTNLGIYPNLKLYQFASPSFIRQHRPGHIPEDRRCVPTQRFTELVDMVADTTDPRGDAALSSIKAHLRKAWSDLFIIEDDCGELLIRDIHRCIPELDVVFVYAKDAAYALDKIADDQWDDDYKAMCIIIQWSILLCTFCGPARMPFGFRGVIEAIDQSWMSEDHSKNAQAAKDVSSATQWAAKLVQTFIEEKYIDTLGSKSMEWANRIGHLLYHCLANLAANRKAWKSENFVDDAHMLVARAELRSGAYNLERWAIENGVLEQWKKEPVLFCIDAENWEKFKPIFEVIGGDQIGAEEASDDSELMGAADKSKMSEDVKTNVRAIPTTGGQSWVPLRLL